MIEEAKLVHYCTDSFKVVPTILEDGSNNGLNSCSHHSVRDTASMTSVLNHVIIKIVAEPTLGETPQKLNLVGGPTCDFSKEDDLQHVNVALNKFERL
jgi:hypothetical protein